MVGAVWGGECGARDGVVWGCGGLEVQGLDKVGMRFSSVRLIGQVLYWGGKNKIAHTYATLYTDFLLQDGKG